jgi:hypothetical protein
MSLAYAACWMLAPIQCAHAGQSDVLCRDELVNAVHSANAGIRRVNAALQMTKCVPPTKFPRLTPLGMKEYFARNQCVLQQHEMSRISGESMSWEKDTFLFPGAAHCPPPPRAPSPFCFCTPSCFYTLSSCYFGCFVFLTFLYIFSYIRPASPFYLSFYTPASLFKSVMQGS